MRLRLILAVWAAIAVLTTALAALVTDGNAWAIVAVAWLASGCTLAVTFVGLARVSRSRSVDIASASEASRLDLSAAVTELADRLNAIEDRASLGHESMVRRTQDLADAAGAAATDLRGLDRRVAGLEDPRREITTTPDGGRPV